MAKPTRAEYQQLTRPTLLLRFLEECVQPSRQRVHADLLVLDDEERQLVRDAKDYFRSRYADLPRHREALYLLAKARLVERLVDETMVESEMGTWDSSYHASRNARLILLPENSWNAPLWYDPRVMHHHEGFGEYAAALVRSFAAKRTSQSPPPPPKDLMESDLESKVFRAERELEKHRADLKTYREAKQKAAQEKAERERVARERAEQEAKDKLSKERAERERMEREARERAAREQRAREQSSNRGTSPPQWALVLKLTPPYTEDQIRSAYRKMSKLTHPDLGGTDKEFREVDSAYDSAMNYCRSLRA